MTDKENTLSKLVDTLFEAMALIKVFDDRRLWGFVTVDADGKYHAEELRLVFGSISHRESYAPAAVCDAAIDLAVKVFSSLPNEELRAQVANW